jgi:hypothetical protein
VTTTRSLGAATCDGRKDNGLMISRACAAAPNR